MELVKRGRGRPRKTSTPGVFLVSVKWQVAGQYLVHATSMEQALQEVEENQELFPLEEAQSEYVDDSFEINKDCCCKLQPQEIPSFNQKVVNVIPVGGIENQLDGGIENQLDGGDEQSHIENLVSEEFQPIDEGAVCEESDEGFDGPIPSLVPPTL